MHGEYAVHDQRDRRNFTGADILRCVEALEKQEAARRTAMNAELEGLKKFRDRIEKRLAELELQRKP